MNSIYTVDQRVALQDDEANFLLDFYYSLKMDKVTSNHNWFQDNITTCDFTGILCDTDGLVTVLELSGKGLTGSLPSSFWSLSRLQRLLMRNNNIGGTFPIQIPRSLIHVNVDRNMIRGPIPSFSFSNRMSMEPQLQRLIISDNLFDSSIPEDLCGLSQLRALNLSRNRNLTGTIPTCLANLPHLEGLQVHQTSVIGPVSDQLCRGDQFRDNHSVDGLCPRFGFCSNGYRQILGESNDEDDNVDDDNAADINCIPCTEPSNVLASETCQWVDTNISFHPTTPPTTFIPWSGSNAPGSESTTGPSLPPTMVPSLAPSPYLIPSTGPSTAFSKFPSLGHPSQGHSEGFLPTLAPSVQTSISSSDQPSQDVPVPFPSYFSTIFPTSQPSIIKFPTSVPTTFPPSVAPPTGNNVDSVLGSSTNNGANSRREGKFATKILIPLLSMIVCLALVVFLFAVPKLVGRRRRRQREEEFCLVSSVTSEENDGGVDICLENGVPCVSSVTAEFPSNDALDEITVCSRPCIVQPQTLSGNPKVRFLLLAKTYPEEENAELPDETGKVEQLESCPNHPSCSRAQARWFQLNSCHAFPSIFRKSCSQIQETDSSDVSEHCNAEATTPTTVSSDTSLNTMHSWPSSVDGEEASSSVSTTTPSLNPVQPFHHNIDATNPPIRTYPNRIGRHGGHVINMDSDEYFERPTPRKLFPSTTTGNITSSPLTPRHLHQQQHNTVWNVPLERRPQQPPPQRKKRHGRKTRGHHRRSPAYHLGGTPTLGIRAMDELYTQNEIDYDDDGRQYWEQVEI